MILSVYDEVVTDWHKLKRVTYRREKNGCSLGRRAVNEQAQAKKPASVP